MGRSALMLLLLAGCGCLAAAEILTEAAQLRQDQLLPDDLAGPWLRLRDGAWLDLPADAALADLQTGSYTSDGHHLLLIRPSDDAAGQAMSLVGLPVVDDLPRDLMITNARSGQALSPLSLPVVVWRLADDWPWPWVDHAGLLGGLAGICRQYNADGDDGFVYDQQTGCYCDASGRPVRIGAIGSAIAPILERGPGDGPVTIALGDLVAAVPPGERRGRSGILVRDGGRHGFFDPADELVSADAPGPGEAEAVARIRVGELLGPLPVFVYQRSRERGESLRRSRLRPDNPIWHLPRWRQYLALAGMVILIVSLFRLGRRFRRR